ncbi:MAG: TetR family transcriptional regulator [Candidatus Palauibacterales bacterium]|nr:TetR family transcriptional regulator [Candidatus Palauibacterales bacterium]
MDTAYYCFQRSWIIAARDTPRTLLVAARPLFAREGFTGTSVRDITRAARVNLGAVTYHFGSKRALYEAVLAEATQPLMEALDGVAARGESREDAAARIETALRALFRILREEPDLPGLLFQEAAAGREPPEPVAKALHALLERLAALVREGKSYGSVEAGDPVLTGASLLAQTLSFGLLWRTLGPSRTRGVMGRTAAGLEAHVVDFTRRALRPPAGPAAR